MNNVKQLNDLITKELEEHLPKAMGLPDWQYRDLPRMKPELFDKFVEIVGEENIRWITKADYGDCKRGQLLISPEGMKKLKEFNERKENNEDA